MTTLTGIPAPAAASRSARGPRLRGLTWLVRRQHWAAFWTVLAATVACVALIAFLRAGMMDHLHTIGWPHPTGENWERDVRPDADRLSSAGSALGFVPVLLGVFLGAPLLAGDLEHGTAKPITSQSVTRVRRLAMKPGMTALVVTVCAVAASAAFSWWYEPLKAIDMPPQGWISGVFFDNTGPVPVALTLFTILGGVAIGMLLRRVLAAMAVTFGFAVAVPLVGSYLRMDLGSVVTMTTHQGVGEAASPELPGRSLPVGPVLPHQRRQTHRLGHLQQRNDRAGPSRLPGQGTRRRLVGGLPSRLADERHAVARRRNPVCPHPRPRGVRPPPGTQTTGLTFVSNRETDDMSRATSIEVRAPQSGA
ncbi:hypothetical protein [Streptomyces chattanoogensis]|uniref:hypothetical protein n=1 Tax=Streptomyces chattanoogensis TaxID=66876 RepID=UPI000A49DA90|nr:hypothetical protein [Streptomyces chattanoogensis]